MANITNLNPILHFKPEVEEYVQSSFLRKYEDTKSCLEVKTYFIYISQIVRM